MTFAHGAADGGHKDNGYITGNSDDVHNASLDSSLEDIPEDTRDQHPHIPWPANASSSPVEVRRSPLETYHSPQETHRTPLEAAADTFRGRAPLPQVTASPATDREPMYTDETRRQMRTTVNAYIPSTHSKSGGANRGMQH